jgi:hypothetical protein
MQVRCKVYGFTNASSGVECAVERDLLEVGEYLHHNDRDYIIVSVVESQGCWFANVVPEYQRQFMRRPPLQRRQEDTVSPQESLDEWRHRAVQAEHKLQSLQEEHGHFGERLDHLMQMLEHLTKEPESPQRDPHRSLSRWKGTGEHVR